MIEHFINKDGKAMFRFIRKPIYGSVSPKHRIKELEDKVHELEETIGLINCNLRYSQKKIAELMAENDTLKVEIRDQGATISMLRLKNACILEAKHKSAYHERIVELCHENDSLIIEIGLLEEEKAELNKKHLRIHEKYTALANQDHLLSSVHKTQVLMNDSISEINDNIRGIRHDKSFIGNIKPIRCSANPNGDPLQERCEKIFKELSELRDRHEALLFENEALKKEIKWYKQKLAQANNISG